MAKPTVFVTRRVPRECLDLLKPHFQLEHYNKGTAIPRKVLLKSVKDKDGLLCVLTDKIDPAGLKPLETHPGIELLYQIAPKPEELEKILPGVGAWLVRSETKITADWIAKASDLRLIGRAGVGVDNIDLEAATAKGILVLNTAAASTLSTAEHALALMMSLARKIPAADAHVKCAIREIHSDYMGEHWLATFALLALEA